MENASKALIIAGGIFLAIAILTLGVYTYTQLHEAANAQDAKNMQDQLVAFNKRYEAYNKTIMRGIDVVTVIYMADEDFKANGILVTITVDGVTRDKDSVARTDGKLTDPMKSEVFHCTGVTYDDTTGRINGMSFAKNH